MKREFISAKGVTPESWLCVDCGVNTAPGYPTRAEVDAAFGVLSNRESIPLHFGPESEIYTVRNAVWEKTGLGRYGGCLCIGCLEKRIGCRLRHRDFEPDHPFNSTPGTPRLLDRRGD